MTHFISGKEIADLIEQEHIQHIKTLTSKGIIPKLAIIQTTTSRVIDTYIGVKKKYAEKIGVEILHLVVSSSEADATIKKLNADPNVHGIIIQLPLDSHLSQAETLNLVAKEKDIDGLSINSFFIPPTVQAILKLIDTYIKEIATKKVALVGKGVLVGAPLERELVKRNIIPVVFTKEDSLDTLCDFDIIVSATGVPSLIRNIHIKSGAYVLDAGTAEENGAIHGDISDEVFERADIHLTPIKGGIGILTVRSLFENLLRICDQK